MLRFLLAFTVAVFACLPPLWADDPLPAASKDQVDWSEVARWGDRVVISGEGARQDVGEMLFTMAMAPPEDDSDMWYITVWGMKDCPACKSLLKAFETDNALTPFVAVPPGKKKAWAHFNYYQLEDTTQRWRFKDFKVENGPFPIITIQAPRNKMFGDPRIVIDRIEARDCGRPAAVGKRITDSVNLWCKKLQQSGYQPPIHAMEAYGYSGYGHRQTGPVTVEQDIPRGGPWGPDPPQPVQINPQFPFGPSQNPAVTVNPTDGSGGILDTLLSGKAGTLFLLIIAALRMWETVGPFFGYSGGLAKNLRDFLEKISPPPAVAPVTPGTPVTPVVNASMPGVQPTVHTVLPDGKIVMTDGSVRSAPT